MLAESPPGSRNSWGWVIPILQLGKQQQRSPRTSPGCIFRCCWIKGHQGLAGDSGQCQASSDPAHVGEGQEPQLPPHLVADYFTDIWVKLLRV